MNKPRSRERAVCAKLRPPRNPSVLFLAVAGALAAACGSTPSFQLFGGPERPSAERTAPASGEGGAGIGGSAEAGVSIRGSGGVGVTGGAHNGSASGGDVGSSGGAGSSGSSGGIDAGGTGAIPGSGGDGGARGSGGGSGAQPTGGASPGGGPASGGAGNGGGGTGDDGGPPDRPPCVTKPSEIVLIGDSYVNWATHTFQADLTRVSGIGSRLYAMGGASMATGGITTLIPDQFENALKADSGIRVVVMDGGGNDILVPAATWVGGSECKNRADSPNVPVCQQIVQATFDRERKLMDRMADAGIRDVVFFFYPTVPNGTVLGGSNPNAIAAWARPQVKAGCDEAYERTGRRLRCHFVDLVPVFQGHPEYFTTADIHPNTSGSAQMAKAVWSTMTSDCVAQKANSGCCEP